MNGFGEFYCPTCQAKLGNLKCPGCKKAYGISPSGFPMLTANSRQSNLIEEISKNYDSIYQNHTNVWLDQGRTPEFLAYFANLCNETRPVRSLEVGCGEGLLLAMVACPEKSAIDISDTALSKARARSPANFILALAENIPFSDHYFDLVYSVGVMEHFLDDESASKEIWRVLKPGGRYFVLIHVRLTTIEKIKQKIRDYVFPTPRPLGFVTWLWKKVRHPIHQPIQRHYSVESAAGVLRAAGLTINRTISLKTDPLAPLIGPHVVIYECTR